VGGSAEATPVKPLHGIRVVEAATLFAAPIAGMLLGDYGADVIKIEHPRRPDPARGHGPSKDDVGLWFKTLGRNKRLVTLDLSQPDGRDLFLRLAERSDVVLENFRPGTLERWGLGWDELSAVNPRLVLARVSGFGQTGPYAGRPGFGTLAEAMSGFAALNGEPGGPPLLPPLALADGVAALATAFAIMVALRAREETGRGQIVDTSLVEPLLMLLGPQVTAYDLLGTLQERTGNRSSHNAPRNVYRTADDAWVAVSASATSIAERVLRLVGRADLTEQPWFATGAGRAAHVDEIDAAVAAWIAARSRDDVLAAFDAAEAAIAPVYDARDLLADPQLAAIDAIVPIDDDELGPIKMTNMISRLSETPGGIERTGRAHGADTAEVLAEVGVDAAELQRLRAGGVV
jgi:crotonobetainyl-CoA:carnitine CoA-transferase CaiB-like acyl-CoA transferase